MALFGRKRSDDPELLDDEFDDFDDDFVEYDEAPQRPAPPVTLKPSTMRDWEIPVGFVVAGLIIVVALVELGVTHGAGAPARPPRILPIVAIVLGFAVALTIRWHNRLLTGVAAAAAALVLTAVQVPNAVGIVRTVGFLGTFAYAFVIIQRQSSQQRKLNKANGPSARGGSRRGQPAPEPTTGPKRSRRYTPPKPKDDRSRARRR